MTPEQIERRAYATEGARPEPEHDDGACARCGDTDGDVWVIIARPGYFCRHCVIQLTGRDPEG